MPNIIRTSKNKENPYTMINRKGLNDSRLSFKARGILAYLLDKPDNWQVVVQDLVNNAPEGRTAIYSGLKELEKFGYLKRAPVRDEKKRFLGYESIVYEEPTESCPKETDTGETPENKAFSPYAGNLNTGNPNTENLPLTITDINNTEKKQQQDPVVNDLLKLGVKKPKAEKLAEEHPPDQLARWITAAKGKRNPAGYIVKALSESWELPPSPPVRKEFIPEIIIDADGVERVLLQ